MTYHDDIRLGETLDIKFTSRRFSTGAPFTLAGSPVISAYIGNSTTQITAGITLTVDFDGVTGLNNVRVVATSGNGFATATNVKLVITTGTVDSVSVVGEVVGSFSIENRSALMPTTAGRTLDVSAGGEAGVDWANVGSPTTAVNLSGTTTNLVNTATTYTGNTPQTGDGYAIVNSGTHGNGALKTLIDTLDNVVDTEIGDIQARLPAALVGGRIDATVDGTGMEAGAVAAIVAGVWDEPTAGNTTSGTFGAAVVAAGSGGDPWETSLPGAYGSGTAGKLIGDNINATVSSRATPAQVNTEADTALSDVGVTLDRMGALTDWIDGGRLDVLIDAIKAKTDTLPAFPSNFASFAINASGHVVLQDASLVTAKLGVFVLAKTTHISGFNDIAATAIVSGGAITTSAGAVSTVTTTATATAVTTVNGFANNVITTLSIADGAITDAKITVPTVAGVSTGILGMVVQVWRRFFKKSTLTATQLKTYAEDGTTVLTTQTVSDDGTTQTQGVSS